MTRSPVATFLFLIAVAPLAAQSPADSTVPDLAAIIATPRSELGPVVARWTADRSALGRRYQVSYSPERSGRYRLFHSAWQQELAKLPFARLSREAQVDYLLLQTRLRHEQRLLDREERLMREMAPLVPFADTLFVMIEERRQMERPDPAVSAARITWMADRIDQARTRFSDRAVERPARSVALRASETIADYRRQFDQWRRHYAGYDPEITWRIAEPAKRLDASLESWRRFLREQMVGARDGQDEPIVGDPIGADGLAADLANEMIAYTPQELIAIAEKEYAFLLTEAKRASREMGFGDDWKAAMEKVKQDYAPIGTTTSEVRDMAWEAVDWLESRQAVTIPPLAKEIWRMEMMSAEAQKTNPFFLGGEVIMVASPTDGQSEAEKLASLRANNRHFQRAVAHHELIPGHHLQGFTAARGQTHRSVFSTPFYTEGWALWWELHMWDQNFAASPENRMGMLFWRMHRAARIIFSLKFHLGEWTPEQCIDFLVETVGHERESATGEVRRSFNGNYSPLYQAGYLLGGMQLRALHREVVVTGKMSEKEFHDRVLATGQMPIEMVRALLRPELPLAPDWRPQWKFGG